MTNKMPCRTMRDERRAGYPRALAVAVLAIAGAVSFAGCSPKPDDKSQTTDAAGNVMLTADQLKNVHLYTVAPSRFHNTITTSGIVDFDNDQATSVLAPFSGPVSRLLVSPGQIVRKGEPLAIVDSPDFAAGVDAYRKAVSSAQTLRRLADLDKDLVQHQGVSKREADQAETDAVGAESDREAALKALVSLHADQQTIENIRNGHPISRVEGTIRSPLAGTVAEKLITPGLFLQAGTTPCFTIADLSRVWVIAQLFGPELASVSVGDRVFVETGAPSKEITGKVDNIATLVDPNTRSVGVRVVVDNPGNILKKQMYVGVRIEAREESTGFLVPVSGVLRDDENLPFVYVVQRDGALARRHVTLGNRIGDRYDIASGLSTGDRIVIDGAIFVQFMQTQ
jgi:membrane fusion protein, heavy metal efflux system